MNPQQPPNLELHPSPDGVAAQGAPTASSPPKADVRPADEQLNDVSQMLGQLEEVEATAKVRAQQQPHENQLIQVRLGVAAGLFAALRAKHPASAAHSLRVAMGCSAWGMALELPPEQVDEIEVAALLHDIGKIGVPDHVLLKPAGLEPEERELMQRHREMGLDILASCSSSLGLLDTVFFAPAWYNGANGDFDRSENDLPLGSRILAIVDAYDSMTTDSVWRRALSRERALAELFQYAGTQFDPHLVKHYCTLQVSDQSKLQARVARRWLQEIAVDQSNQIWSQQLPGQIRQAAGGGSSAGSWFHHMLVENMHDAVIFIDNSLKIQLWNNGAQRMTGRSGESVIGQQWLPRLVEMSESGSGLIISDDACPVRHVITTGVQQIRRVTVSGRGSEEVAVNAHFMPAISDQGTTHGAVILLHDASSESTLEEKIQTLNEKATIDPLTKVANRAEFDRLLEEFLDTHLEAGLPCALIMCDIDHFKKINDTYGHQAGDEALVGYAALLKRSCRSGDVVARYGGEEFAMLCADTDNATATSRAERIRLEISRTTHDALKGRSFTSSFGVTEVQPGDTPETMLRRADRALYQAKEMGRNMVVQLGSGLDEEESPEKTSWWKSLFGGGQGTDKNQLLNAQLIAGVPMKIVVEKLRGFVADQEATISQVDEDQVLLTIDRGAVPMQRRTSDRAVPYMVELKFEEREFASEGARGATIKTLIHITIRTKHSRDRREQDTIHRARQMVSSLKSYLVAQEYLADEH